VRVGAGLLESRQVGCLGSRVARFRFAERGRAETRQNSAPSDDRAMRLTSGGGCRPRTSSNTTRGGSCSDRTSTRAMWRLRSGPGRATRGRVSGSAAACRQGWVGPPAFRRDGSRPRRRLFGIHRAGHGSPSWPATTPGADDRQARRRWDVAHAGSGLKNRAALRRKSFNVAPEVDRDLAPCDALSRQFPGDRATRPR